LEDVADEGWWKMRIDMKDMDISGEPPTSSKETSALQNDLIS
jgi:hypothetical protein